IAPPPEVKDALLPPLRGELPDILPDLEPRFDISVNNSRAREFFMSLVKGTTLNMVVHPDVTGTISLTLRDITIEDVLSTTRDVYGYRYQRNGNTYQVYPARIRTQIFTVDYLHAVRSGGSRTTVSSGRISGNGSDSDSGSSGTTANARGSSTSGSIVSGSVVSTESESNFWSDLKESLKMIIGDEGGRKVMVHPQSGVIVVHALPEELRNVEEFLHTIENAAHRLVILEAKIIEVTLDDKFQAGINWNALFEFGDDKSILFGHAGGGSVFDTGASSLAGATVPLVRGTQVIGFDTTAIGGVFTIDANLKDFNALIELLKTQGDVQVLSSPRISTVNNQKAVIKVGQDEFFVTDVETETDAGSGVLNTSVDVTLTPFFSGVALDVIPQISDDDNVILHIHPAISEVTEKIKDISTSSTDELSIPLALSTIRETDTVIRAKSGQVVVLGGLMKNAMRDEESRTPILGDVPVVGDMFRHNRSVASKSELVILLRPVVIDSNRQWNGQLRSTADRFRNLRPDNRSGGQLQTP
ncbi:MAG: pilus (MSHA type) biogenesis protein MshL, partial [Gammaproteobacteria bacterium]|nr:pilus (MSHA type) biogenesis protein MshL [Gammaproteobacteria bacterium]